MSVYGIVMLLIILSYLLCTILYTILYYTPGVHPYTSTTHRCRDPVSAQALHPNPTPKGARPATGVYYRI